MTVESEEGLRSLYRHRFPPELLERRKAVWRVLCQSWFSKYISVDARVLEVGAGYCEFINNVRASQCVAVDLNPDVSRHAASHVEVRQVAAERLSEVLPPDFFDVAFMSNFLEHCRTRESVVVVLRSISQVLKPGGRLLILGPNYRYCSREYFDFFDHHLALSERAVEEALTVAGLIVEEVHPRTLPLTFRSRLPSWPWLVSLYLRSKWAWPFFGQQFFVVARRPDP